MLPPPRYIGIVFLHMFMYFWSNKKVEKNSRLNSFPQPTSPTLSPVTCAELDPRFRPTELLLLGVTSEFPGVEVLGVAGHGGVEAMVVPEADWHISQLFTHQKPEEWLLQPFSWKYFIQSIYLRLPGLHNFRPLKFELDFWPSQLPFKHFRPCDRKRSLCLGSKMFENSKETWFWETFLNPVPTPYVSEIYQFSTSNLSLPQTHTHAIACFTAHAVVDPGTFLQQIGTLPSMPETNFGSSFWNQFFWTDGQFFQQNPH